MSRKGAKGHSVPFGNRKPQRRRVPMKVPMPRNVGHAAKMRAEQAGPVRTQRGKRPRVRPKAHTGPYVPDHGKDHRAASPSRPGSSTREQRQ